MAQRMEWRFEEGSVLSVGHWYMNWGDPRDEHILTLTQLVQTTGNATWCLREHGKVLDRIADGAQPLLADLASLGIDENGLPLRLAPHSPIVHSVVRAHTAIHHALSLLVDALVEFRHGSVRIELGANGPLAAELTLSMGDAINCGYLLEQHLPLHQE